MKLDAVKKKNGKWKMSPLLQEKKKGNSYLTP